MRITQSICVSLGLLLWTTIVHSVPHPFEYLEGLKRFDINQQLPGKPQSSVLNIKGTFIGDNVLQQAVELAAQGGVLGRIRGGSRSDKIKFDFNQTYKASQLQQEVEIYFDKYNGFIQQVTATYTLKDAYLSIDPVREQALQAAIKKYGEPLTIAQAQQISGKNSDEIKLSEFIAGLKKQSQLQPAALDYFQARNISRSAKLVKDQQGFALMHTGFDRCYTFYADNFDQLLSFCFFDKTGANANSRGVELDLHHFSVSQQVKELGNGNLDPQISL